MDYNKLAELLFPNTENDTQVFETMYPKRKLPNGAKVTRLAPSPTGFIHLGNLFSAFADERLAHKSGGVFYLRIEDTDDKRYVEGAVETIIGVLEYFNIKFDEGAGIDGDKGIYKPYHQSRRAEIYQSYVKQLVATGFAYPCFLTEEEISEIRKKQEAVKANPGIYGEWAVCRNLSFEEIEEKLKAGTPYVIRLKSKGDADAAPDQVRTVSINDAVRGELIMPENTMDIVILKATGIPTYHFAHVVDDHLMRTTHVIRGEEWLSSLPIHVELFELMGWELPIYCHTAHLMKMDEGGKKRKLSKRKDPELSLDYYRQDGYFPQAVREYLMTVLNSNFEEWRIANPDADVEEFEFSAEKMSSSGALFDLVKLHDVCKDVLVKLPADEIFDFMTDWAEKYRSELYPIFAENREYIMKILDIGRNGDKPRKDLIYASQIFEFIKYFFDEYFVIEDKLPENVPQEDVKPILEGYLARYNHSDDRSEWFDKIRMLAVELGYAAKPKDFKKNPGIYKGHVGDVSTVIRLAITGRTQSPDIWEIQNILGEERTASRVKAFM